MVISHSYIMLDYSWPGRVTWPEIQMALWFLRWDYDGEASSRVSYWCRADPWWFLQKLVISSPVFLRQYKYFSRYIYAPGCPGRPGRGETRDVTKPLIERKWMGFIVSFTNGYHWCHQWFNHLKWPPIFGAVFGPGLFMVTIFDVLDRHPLTGTCQLTMSVKSHQQTDGHIAP